MNNPGYGHELGWLEAHAKPFVPGVNVLDEDGRGMVIIALTGWGQDVDRAQFRQAGCDGHLVKR